MKTVAVASPNKGGRPLSAVVDCIVLHADAATSATSSVDWIRSSASKVSYHSLIDRDGTQYKFVETTDRAWACGASTFEGRANVNNFSVSLAFANRNDGVEPYTPAQYLSGSIVAAEWTRAHPAITLDRITTHAAIAPGRKTDPLGFDVQRFVELVRSILEAEG